MGRPVSFGVNIKRLKTKRENGSLKELGALLKGRIMGTTQQQKQQARCGLSAVCSRVTTNSKDKMAHVTAITCPKGLLALDGTKPP